jgi:polysaccharide biosynthesis PFTS motif protein
MSKIDLLIKEICIMELEESNEYKVKGIIENLNLADLAMYRSQYVVTHLFGSFYFNRAISYYYSGESLFLFPIKDEWRPLFKKYEININKLGCKILWKLYIFHLTIKQLVKFGKNSISQLSRGNSNSNYSDLITQRESIFFCDLAASNISTSLTQKVYCFTNWYLRNVANLKVCNIYHNVPNLESTTQNTDFEQDLAIFYNQRLFFAISTRQFTKNYLLALRLIKNTKFYKKELSYVLFNLGNCIDSTNSIARLKTVNLRSVVFNNSVGSLKPLWAVALERKGIEVSYCFYAAYSDPLDENLNRKKDGLWALANWSKYYVFDELHAQELSEDLLIQGSKIIPKILPWWSDIDSEIPDFKEPALCLFDAALHNNLYIRSNLNIFGWDSPKIALSYLESVLEVCRTNNLKVYYKNKRSKSMKTRNQEHFHGVETILTKYRSILCVIDERVAPIRIIQKSFLTVSKPFSTTGFIASSIGKPSVFFDPTGKISKVDTSRRELDVINSQKELNTLIKNLLTKNN